MRVSWARTAGAGCKLHLYRQQFFVIANRSRAGPLLGPLQRLLGQARQHPWLLGRFLGPLCRVELRMANLQTTSSYTVPQDQSGAAARGPHCRNKMRSPSKPENHFWCRLSGPERGWRRGRRCSGRCRRGPSAWPVTPSLSTANLLLAPPSRTRAGRRRGRRCSGRWRRGPSAWPVTPSLSTANLLLAPPSRTRAGRRRGRRCSGRWRRGPSAWRAGAGRTLRRCTARCPRARWRRRWACRARSSPVRLPGCKEYVHGVNAVQPEKETCAGC